jgi:ribonuclease-3
MSTLEEHIGYTFRDRGLLNLALTHKSFVEGSGSNSEFNERLEFLGDAVLNFILTSRIYELYSGKDEGELSKIRAHLVSAATLFDISQTIALTYFVKLGRGELKSSGRKKSSIISSALEALIGALYLDAGIDACRRIVLDLFAVELRKISDFDGYINDFKSELQEVVQEHIRELPVYVQVADDKSNAQKEFEVIVTINDQEVGRGRGKSKKDAEQEAAFAALKNIKNFNGYHQLSQTFFLKKERS